MFKDRIEACQRLSEELSVYCKKDCIIIGIPRGGAVIAHCLSEELSKPWDIIVPRKIGAPFNKEVAIGAVTQDGNMLLNEEIVKYYDIPEEYISKEARSEVIEIERRIERYRGKADFPDVSGKTVILVDDGIATGFTMVAAINSIKKHNAGKVIVAVPVAPVEAIDSIKMHVDEVVCIEIPKPFMSVGSSYYNFEQNTDEEIISLFKQSTDRRFV